MGSPPVTVNVPVGRVTLLVKVSPPTEALIVEFATPKKFTKLLNVMVCASLFTIPAQERVLARDRLL